MDMIAKSPLSIAVSTIMADQILEKCCVGLDPNVHWLLVNGSALLMAIVLVGEALECTQRVVLSFDRCALSAISSWSRVRKAFRRSSHGGAVV